MTCSSCGLALKFDRWSLARSFSWKLSNSSPVQKKWLKNVDRWAVGHAPGPKHTTTNFGRDRRTFPSSDSKYRRPRRTDVDIGDKGRRALPSTIMTLGGVLLWTPLPRHAASQNGVVVYDVLTRYRTCLTFVLLCSRPSGAAELSQLQLCFCSEFLGDLSLDRSCFCCTRPTSYDWSRRTIYIRIHTPTTRRSMASAR